jgi:hypothetical protein
MRSALSSWGVRQRLTPPEAWNAFKQQQWPFGYWFQVSAEKNPQAPPQKG